ncbi:MAG TPA: DinB family protein [bacterium]|nr:DinB family protein [bacterium]
MDDRALIQQQLGASRQILARCVGDVSEDEARRMPDPTLSPIVWQVGHLASADAFIMQRAGVAPASSVPAAYADLFKSGTGGKADYPPLDEVVRVFEDTHDALLRAIAEADLGAPDEGPLGLWTNAAGLFAFANTHRWYHVGKINSLRALLGKPRPLG